MYTQTHTHIPHARFATVFDVFAFKADEPENTNNNTQELQNKRTLRIPEIIVWNCSAHPLLLLAIQISQDILIALPVRPSFSLSNVIRVMYQKPITTNIYQVKNERKRMTTIINEKIDLIFLINYQMRMICAHNSCWINRSIEGS